MMLIYSLIFVTGLSLLFTSSIKKYNTYIYTLCIFITISDISYLTIWANSDFKIPEFLVQIEIASHRGIIATALIILVMFIGAMDTSWKSTRKLLSIRGELAIISSILILVHIVVYLLGFIKYAIIPYFRGQTIPNNYLFLSMIGIIATFIMIPLFITSFKKIRKKIKAKKWKKIQRWSYVYYFLIYLHVIIIIINHDNIEWIKFISYNFIFGSYTIMRIMKHYKIKHNIGKIQKVSEVKF